MFTALGGMNHLNTMPMVRCADNNRIDVFALENITIVVIRFDSGAGFLKCPDKPTFIYVADRCNVGNAGFMKSFYLAKESAAPSTYADVRRGYSLVRPNSTRCCQDAGGYKIRHARRRCPSGS